RLLPRAVALILGGAISIDGRRAKLDPARADANVPRPLRALLSVSDKAGLAEFGRGLVERGFELVSTGGTGRSLRDAGLPVTDVRSPARYDEVLAALDRPEGVSLGLRSALAVEAFRHTAAYDARIAAELPCRMDKAGVELPPDAGLPRSADPFPPVLVLPL